MNIAYFIVYVIICGLIAMTWADKKRIGGEWGFFFLVFTSILFGCIFISMSPNKSKIKNLKDGYYGLDKVVGYTAIVLGILSLYNLFRGGTNKIWYTDEQRNMEYVRYLFIIAGCAGVAGYMLTRFKRHEKMYNKANSTELPGIEPVKEIKGEIGEDEWYFERKE